VASGEAAAQHVHAASWACPRWPVRHRRRRAVDDAPTYRTPPHMPIAPLPAPRRAPAIGHREHGGAVVWTRHGPVSRGSRLVSASMVSPLLLKAQNYSSFLCVSYSVPLLETWFLTRYGPALNVGKLGIRSPLSSLASIGPFFRGVLGVGPATHHAMVFVSGHQSSL